MKSKILLISFLTFSINLFSQSISDVIYIDLNSSTNSISEIEDKLKDILGSNDQFLLYIANGKEPIHTNLQVGLSAVLEDIYLLNPRPSNYNFDILQINKMLRTHGFVNNINSISYKSSLKTKLNFHFFFNKKEYENDVYNRFIKNLLLTNKLHYSTGQIHKDVSLFLYENNNDFKSITKEKL
jgi:hypothetical protein